MVEVEVAVVGDLPVRSCDAAPREQVPAREVELAEHGVVATQKASRSIGGPGRNTAQINPRAPRPAGAPARGRRGRPSPKSLRAYTPTSPVLVVAPGVVRADEAAAPPGTARSRSGRRGGRSMFTNARARRSIRGSSRTGTPATSSARKSPGSRSSAESAEHERCASTRVRARARSAPDRCSHARRHARSTIGHLVDRVGLHVRDVAARPCAGARSGSSPHGTHHVRVPNVNRTEESLHGPIGCRRARDSEPWSRATAAIADRDDKAWAACWCAGRRVERARPVRARPRGRSSATTRSSSPAAAGSSRSRPTPCIGSRRHGERPMADRRDDLHCSRGRGRW